MNDAGEFRGAIRGFILDRFYVPQPERLADHDSLLESGVVDSTGVLEVIGFLEEQYGIQVENAEILPENLDSIERLVAFLTRKVQATTV